MLVEGYCATNHTSEQAIFALSFSLVVVPTNQQYQQNLQHAMPESYRQCYEVAIQQQQHGQNTRGEKMSWVTLALAKHLQNCVSRGATRVFWKLVTMWKTRESLLQLCVFLVAPPGGFFLVRHQSKAVHASAEAGMQNHQREREWQIGEKWSTIIYFFFFLVLSLLFLRIVGFRRLIDERRWNITLDCLHALFFLCCVVFFCFLVGVSYTVACAERAQSTKHPTKKKTREKKGHPTLQTKKNTYHNNKQQKNKQ